MDKCKKPDLKNPTKADALVAAQEEACKQLPAKPPLAEDVFSDKLDMCLTDTAVKASAGGIIGALTSLMFIRGRWPMIAGMGIGIGIAWANCEHELNTQTQQNKI